MKSNYALTRSLILSALFFLSGFTSATTLNGRFLLLNKFGEKKSDDLCYAVRLQVNTNTGADDLGGATIVLSFDSSQLYFPSNPAAGKDYIFSEFHNGNYLPSTVTKVLGNQIWINIVLDKKDKGSVLKGSEGWTDLVTLLFKKESINPENCLIWETESPFWAVFDGNNSALWNNGNFNNTPEIEEENIPPLAYELNQNFPNPFNPETKINFTLKKEGNVKLALFSILGEEIQVILEAKLEQGPHSVSFNGSDLASGIYIYKIDVDKDFSAVKKMLLLK